MAYRCRVCKIKQPGFPKHPPHNVCEKCFPDFYAQFWKKKKLKDEKIESKLLAEKEKREKEERIAIVKTHKDYLKELQTIFNKFIRTRDEGKPCISCGRDLQGRKVDASHYIAVSTSSALRFHPDNVHSACVPCNQFKSGNLIEYGKRLPGRIGQKAFDELSELQHKEVKLSIPQIKEMIQEYKLKIKNLTTKKKAA